MVERPPATPTGATDGFFPRRWSRRIRTLGSPKTPRTVALGRKPGKRYVSSSRRSFRIRESCQIFSRLKSYRSLVQSHYRALSDAILPIQIPEEPINPTPVPRRRGLEGFPHRRTSAALRLSSSSLFHRAGSVLYGGDK